VVIPARGTTPDLETLLDAACLALKHSGTPTGERGEVAYTRVKYVRRAGAPGLVTFSQDKTLYVEVSPERLARVTRME
jgi:predicted ribosome quality control (RQC) complex YloA/Tae2 family protein